MTNKKILLIGPLPMPITGMSFANKIILNNLPKFSDYKIDFINNGYYDISQTGKFSWSKIFFYVNLYKYLFKIFVNQIIYITPGQSFFGVVKCAPFIFLAKILGKQIIIHIHGNYLHLEYKNNSLIKKFLMHFILSCSSKGIVLSKSLRKNLTPFLKPDKIYLLANFAEDFLFIDSNFKKPLDKPRIIYLSNLMKEKGILDFLQALVILQERKIDFEAKIAGKIESDIASEVENYFQKLKDQITYLGIVVKDEKRLALQNSNIFVLPSRIIEGQPISILEAMASANIVLVTPNDGVEDIFLEGRNGFYIQKENPQDIADKLEFLAKDLSKYQEIMNFNNEIAVKNYRVESFIKNFINILKC